MWREITKVSDKGEKDGGKVAKVSDKGEKDGGKVAKVSDKGEKDGGKVAKVSDKGESNGEKTGLGICSLVFCANHSFFDKKERNALLNFFQEQSLFWLFVYSATRVNCSTPF